MKIHENLGKTYRSKSTCGYCREEGHNQYQCPHVKGDWENFLSRLEIPKDEDGQPIRRGYNYVMYSQSQDFDPLVHEPPTNVLRSWFRACKKAYLVQKERGFDLNFKKKRSIGDARTCGFCGQSGHTRRNCAKMEQLLKDCYKANENWRQAAYKQLVEIGGLSVGACVKVKYDIGNWSNRKTKHATGIITKINWGTVNVFSGMRKRNEDVASPLNVEVLCDGKTRIIKNLPELFSVIGENGRSYLHWGAEMCELESIITNSPTPLPPEWITSYKESFETLVKKRSLEQLQYGRKSTWSPSNLVAHIDAWV